MAEFAPEHTRNEQGWILFPTDAKDRKSLFFPEEVMEHPAKMNFHLQQAIIEYVASQGDVLLDPFGGTGTLMIAALQGHKVILIDIEGGYIRLMQQAQNELSKQVPGAGNNVIIIYGDNRLVLPIPCNHIITSPPYASAFHARSIRKGKYEKDEFEELDRRMNEYSKSPRNISKLNNFLYNQTMQKVYSLCYQSLTPGGTLTIILKDRMEKGKRISLTGWADKACKRLGFETVGRWKWKTPGIQFTKINIMHGFEVVEDEDIMIYRKAQ